MLTLVLKQTAEGNALLVIRYVSSRFIVSTLRSLQKVKELTDNGEVVSASPSVCRSISCLRVSFLGLCKRLHCNLLLLVHVKSCWDNSVAFPVRSLQLHLKLK